MGEIPQVELSMIHIFDLDQMVRGMNQVLQVSTQAMIIPTKPNGALCTSALPQPLIHFVELD